MSGEIKQILGEVASNPKVGFLAASWGFSMKFVRDHLNPVIADIMPFLSIVLIIFLLRLHYINSKKASLELKKLELELDAEKNK